MIPYLLPFIVYITLPYFTGFWSNDQIVAYASRILITLPLLIYFMKSYTEIKVQKNLLGFVVGVLSIFIWLGLDPYYPKILGEAPGFDPTTYFWPAITLKFVGMVVLAPWIEELIFRSFLPRYIAGGENWEKVEVGTFSPFSFIVSASLFGLIHYQWLPGIIMGCLLNWLAMKT